MKVTDAPDQSLKDTQAPPPSDSLQKQTAPISESPGSPPTQSHAPKTQPAQGQLFKELNELREYKESFRLDDDVKGKEPTKYKDDCFGLIAANHQFELLTFFFIGVNSLFIGYDADYTARHGKPDDLYSKDTPLGFIMMENIFAVYFTGEVVIRFLAFKTKRDCLCDGWFVFDFILVTFMVLETWIFPMFGVAGSLAQFSVLRLLRLLRISRMARLMKKCPELMIIIKGLLASVRSVGCTAILLILCLYVWSILFVTEYHEGAKPESELSDTIHYHFGTMGRSMFSLFIMGTILDDVTVVTNDIRKTGNMFMLFLFIAFILISSFTILNMLIGILCEVVSATAEREKSKAAQTSLKEAIRTIFTTLDKDGSGCISRDEFVQMRHEKSVREALKEMSISERHFQKYCEILFHKPGASIDYDTLIKMLLRLRPGNHVSALDLSLLEASLDKSAEHIRDRIKKIKRMVSNADSGNYPSSEKNGAPTPDGKPPNLTTLSPSDESQILGGSVVASSVEARITAKGEEPPLPPTDVDVTKQYPLEMFVRISSDQIIEELERRLGLSTVAS